MESPASRVSLAAVLVALVGVAFLAWGPIARAAQSDAVPAVGEADPASTAEEAPAADEPAAEAPDQKAEPEPEADPRPAPDPAPDPAVASPSAATPAEEEASAAPAITADAAPASTYADWTVGGANPSWTGTTTLPGAVNFPLAGFVTDSTTPTIPSGASSFLGPLTPFGAVFGSSQDEPYLNVRTAVGITPSTTTFTFDTATPPFGWGFALGDIDADTVTISGTDKAGDALTPAELGFMGVFNYCSVSPQPGSCTTPTPRGHRTASRSPRLRAFRP